MQLVLLLSFHFSPFTSIAIVHAIIHTFVFFSQSVNSAGDSGSDDSPATLRPSLQNVPFNRGGQSQENNNNNNLRGGDSSAEVPIRGKPIVFGKEMEVK